MRKATPAAISAILFAAALSTPVHAATTEYWDPQGATALGGSGTWDTTSVNWAPSNSPTASRIQWTDGNDANIGANATGAFTITLGTNISANSLTFSQAGTNTGSYTIAGSNVLTFGSLVVPTINNVTINLNTNVGGTDLNLVSNNTGGIASNVNLNSSINSFTGNVNLGGVAPTGTVTSAFRLEVNFANATSTALPSSTAAFNFNRNFSQVSFTAVNGEYGTLPNNFHLNNLGLTTAFSSDIGSNGNVTLAGLISGSSDLVFGAGASGGQGAITLTHQNTYTGLTRMVTANTALTDGVVRIGVDNALPTTTDVVFGSPTTAATPSGALDLNGHNQSVASIGNLLTMTGAHNGITNTGATLSTLTIKGGTNSLYTGPIGLAPNLTNLAGSNNNIALVLDNGNTGTLTLYGAGTTATGFSGTTYSGGTTINGGTLLVANTTGSATGSGDVVVGTNGRLGNLSSSGTISGHVTSSGTLTPGNVGIAGTLNLAGGLTLNPGANVNLDFASGNSDKIALGGTSDATILSLPATAQSVNINLNDVANSITTGSTYTIASYPAGSLGTLDTSTSGPLKIVRPATGLASLATYTLINDSTDGLLKLSVTGTYGTRITWKGDTTAGTGSGTWDTTSQNFVDSSSNPIAYADPDDVTFDSSSTQGTDPVVVTIAPDGVTPANITVNNTSTRTYTITGGAIKGGSITKTGTGTLILSGSNSYAGGTFINAGGGVLEVASDASLGTAPSSPAVNITMAKSAAGGTTLRFDGDTTLNANRNILMTTTNGGAETIDTNGHNVTIAGQILMSASANFNIAKAGLGTLTLTGDNSTSVGGVAINLIQINAGTIKASQDINLGRSGGGINFAGSGGNVQFGAAFNTNRPFTMASAPGGIDTNGFNVTASGILSGTGAFTKSGSGTLTLTGANTNTGATIVAAGTLLLKSAAFIPLTNTGGLTVNGGKLVLDYTGTTAPDIRGLLISSHSSSSTFTDSSQRIRTTNTADATHGIGYYDNGSQVTVMYTWNGDANLDGTIDADDYALIDRAIAKGSTASWVNGDFNYDNVIDSGDYMLLDTSYALTNPTHTLSPDFLAMRESEFGSAYVTQLVAAVPEPTTMALILGVAPLLLRRRRALAV